MDHLDRDADGEKREFVGLGQLGFLNWTGDFTGVTQAGAFAFTTGDFIGLGQVALASFTRGEFWGPVQIGGIGAFAGRFHGLAQVGGAAVAEHARGAQIGVVTMALEDGAGLQLGAANMSEEMSGAQVGVVNMAKKVRGVQIGVVNHAESLRGLQIGLVNHAEEGGVIPWSAVLNMGFGSDGDEGSDTPIVKTAQE
jgi:hypothetical protein